ncbi:MAG: isoaspartyl peptidase/L-asparaginase [Planctomycetes bacterium]|nr:isoaspartyl peptidase/L-asparaginase [Planctomycetota bacterium]
MEVVPDVVLAIHGGAGTILRENMTPEMDQRYRQALTQALEAGYAALEAGGDALDAVEAAIRPMEDSPLFNSGRGAVLNDEGEVELDASIMDGAEGLAGAVAGARTPRHPITLARRVMNESPHVLFAAEGADRFAEAQGIETMEAAWFVTPRRADQLKRMQARDASSTADLARRPVDEKFGTVGCVALDGDGHLAAGTSTGGMARKAFGRVGDSPIIGAGTWAADATCAVSCTGHGEFFIRLAIAHQLHARMLFGDQGLPQAAREAVLEELPALGGSGGCVALGADGTLVAPFTTAGMYRGWVTRNGVVTVRIHGDERR